MEILKNDLNKKEIVFHDKSNKTLYIARKKPYDKDIGKYKKQEKVILENENLIKYESGDSIVLKITNPTKKDINKAQGENIKLGYEDTKNYLKVRNKVSKRTVQWIKNIIDGVSEKENIVYRDKDFVICKNLADQGSDQFYWLVLFTDQKLYCIRELNKNHLKLLETVKKKVIELIKKEYDIDEEYIKMYFHYHPSAWWLHLHVEHLFSEMGKFHIYTAHSLNDAINNIRLDSTYYFKRTLRITLSKN